MIVASAPIFVAFNYVNIDELIPQRWQVWVYAVLLILPFASAALLGRRYGFTVRLSGMATSSFTG